MYLILCLYRIVSAGRDGYVYMDGWMGVRRGRREEGLGVFHVGI